MMNYYALLKKQLIDQTGHAVYAILVLLPILLFPGNVIAVVSSGVIMGFIREWEQWRKADNLHLWDRLLDISFFGIGAYLLHAIL